MVIASLQGWLEACWVPTSPAPLLCLDLCFLLLPILISLFLMLGLKGVTLSGDSGIYGLWLNAQKVCDLSKHLFQLCKGLSTQSAARLFAFHSKSTCCAASSPHLNSSFHPSHLQVGLLIRSLEVLKATNYTLIPLSSWSLSHYQLSRETVHGMLWTPMTSWVRSHGGVAPRGVCTFAMTTPTHRSLGPSSNPPATEPDPHSCDQHVHVSHIIHM